MDVLCEEDAPLFLRVLEGLRLLEDDALARRLARQRRVSFSKLRLVWRGRDHYAKGAAEKKSRRAPPWSDSGSGRRSGVLLPARGVMTHGLVVRLRPTGRGAWADSGAAIGSTRSTTAIPSTPR